MPLSNPGSVPAAAQMYQPIPGSPLSATSTQAAIDQLAALLVGLQQNAGASANHTQQEIAQMAAFVSGMETGMSTSIANMQQAIAQLTALLATIQNSFKWTDYSPTLLGASSNPTVTYANRVGRYAELGKIVLFYCSFKTTQISKTGLTDTLRISLPKQAIALLGDVELTGTTVQGSLGLAGNTGFVRGGTGYLEVGSKVAGSVTGLVTYGLTSLGLLNSQITFMAAGAYESA
ncbi:hypothetical protein IQ268_08535 [Oculatella sp. LEGE 06141]|uniref:hypothetical protein n=1 Tax=Oculatella sp. LEGE 06141 TaxID=1828648 RepID=UPI0018817FF0|nr:hypothetical protein [Oculatella sp. LEGE 06141]MBE9178604.1 hypothetical protein [Oculatella sp. LEGE 06141]